MIDGTVYLSDNQKFRYASSLSTWVDELHIYVNQREEQYYLSFHRTKLSEEKYRLTAACNVGVLWFKAK